MDNVKNMIQSNETVIEYLIFGCIALEGLNCIERADYNFFIFLFIYYTMIMKHKFQPNPNNGAFADSKELLIRKKAHPILVCP